MMLAFRSTLAFYVYEYVYVYVFMDIQNFVPKLLNFKQKESLMCEVFNQKHNRNHPSTTVFIRLDLS